MGSGKGTKQRVRTAIQEQRATSMLPRGVVWADNLKNLRTLKYEKPSLLVVGGPSGAGKTTFCQRVFGNHVVHSPDEIYKQFGADGSFEDIEEGIPRNSMVFRAANKRATQSLMENKSAIIDAPALLPHLRPIYPQVAERSESAAHLLLITATLEECLVGQHGESRNGMVLDDEVVQKYYELLTRLCDDLKDGTVDWESEGWESIVICSRGTSERITNVTI